MSEYQLDVDISSGSYSVDVDIAGNPTPVGQRWLNGYELSLANRDRWDRLYEMEAENSVFETGYDYAVQVYETVYYKISEQQMADIRTTADGEQVNRYAPRTDLGLNTYESAESRSAWDTYEFRTRAVEREAQENTLRALEEAGLSEFAGTPSDTDEVETEGDDAPDATDLLSDPSYNRVVRGWNQKLNASSEDLSGLVPFCELYAVFDQSDIISKEDEFSTRYTSIRNRMIKVKFTGVKRAEGTFAEPPLPSGLSKDCYIVKVAGDNKSQLQSDSISYDEEIDINTYTTSYKGVPGIGDLAVSRGSAAAQNVKYDLSITLPNPELINERFEYSKLMLMNSPFLIVYGWNIKDSNFNAEYYPPKISTMPGTTNEIVVGDGIGGFWSSAIINLSNFSFSFDTVGHLVGKLTFLNSSGIFLGTLSTAAVGQAMLDQISTPSEEVIKRAGGEDNQDFIWQNGIPWSALPPDTDLAKAQNSIAGQRDIVSKYFDLESATEMTWNEYLQKALVKDFGEENTAGRAEQIRNFMKQLIELGERFLEEYRIVFINDLFIRHKKNMGDDIERSKFAELIRQTGWEEGSSGFLSGDGEGDRGNRYGPDGDENNHSYTSDAIVDQFFEYEIKNAWNKYFQFRFENMGKTSPELRSQTLIPVAVLSGLENIDSGAQYRFTDLASAGTPIKQITYHQAVGQRARLLPLALENKINFNNLGDDAVDQKDIFIRNMPPFGKELQRTIMNDFQDRTNLNFNNFYSSNRKVANTVRNLIESTSVISIPVPVTSEDRMSLEVERRSYSEVFGIPPSDGKKASVPLSKDVMVEFEFLNDIETAVELGANEYDATLSKVTFYNKKVLYSLKNTTFDAWAETALENPNFNEDKLADGVVGQFGDGNFNSYLSHVLVNPSSDQNYQGRFAARKYAVLNNGWIVSQTKATPTEEWKDNGYAKPMVVDDVPSGLFFIKSLLPRASGEIAAADLAEGKSSEETYLLNLRNSIENVGDVSSMSEDEIRLAQSAAALKVDQFSALIDLQNALISAAAGSNVMNQVDMGIANQDETTIEGEGGATVHSIFRQPVYFFLGSVLESLRIATDNSVQFFYSEVPSSKASEPFYISIPEGSADSVKSQYDAQIANLDRQLVELGASSWREEQNKKGDIVVVVGGTTEEERDVAALLASQERWDEYLVDYITHRGQDRAAFETGSKEFVASVLVQDSLANSQAAAGVYSSYTNLKGTNKAVRQFVPHYGFNMSNGSYEDYNEYKNRGGLQTVRAPWIYKIQEGDDYYRGPKGEYETNETLDSSKQGFMRLWRPQDLDAAIAAKANNRRIFYRSPQRAHDLRKGFKVSTQQAFFTDSFGEQSGRVDYGYDYAYNKDGGRDTKRNPGGDFTAETRNANKVIGGLMGWLNWWPVQGNNYTYLGKTQHRNEGSNAANQYRYFDTPKPTEIWKSKADNLRNSKEERKEADIIYKSRTDENIAAGWYLIKWPGGDMWVRGVVVEDFVHFNGTRPSEANREPVVGAGLDSEQRRLDQINDLKNQIEAIQRKKDAGDLNAQFKRLPIRTTYEIPVNINTIKQFLTSEPRAPLHKLLKKVVASAKETIPAIQLSMRPAAMNSSYIDIFPSAVNYDGVIQEIFTEVDVGSDAVNSTDTMGIKAARKTVSQGRFAQSEKVIVCQFGTSQSLVESFGLASKIDPNAFSAFRLPAVVGGATMNVIEVLRNARDDNPDAYSTLLSDFGSILSDGLITGKDALKKLKIVNDGTEGTSTVNYSNLEAFLLSESPAISKAASTLVEDMMSQNVKLYNTILTLQNEFFNNKMKNEEGTIGEPGPRQAGSKFYGNILSTFLRTATLTIHGTTGLSVFNLVYLKGLLSGIEGLYLISSVNESLAASTFVTTLECKLIEYTNNDPKTNPIAYRGASNLNRLASIIDETKARENAEFGIGYSLNRLGDVVEQIDRRNGVFD